jgi:hypothetical protein
MNGGWKADPPQGYWLEFDAEIQNLSHQFCGENQISGAACPVCDKPLLRLLSLDTKDARLNLVNARFPFLHLLYCWTCSIPFGPFVYRIHDDGRIELISYEKDYEYAFGAEGPYDNYPGVFPGRKVGLTPVLSGSDPDDIRHQIGGEPVIANPEFPIQCPSCSSEIPFLAAICDDASGDGFDPGHLSLAGTPGVQMVFHFCRKCCVVSAYHSMD